MGIYPFDAVLNGIFWLLAPLGPQLMTGANPRDGILAWVTQFRKSMEMLKNPRFVKDMAAGLAKKLSHVAWTKGGMTDMFSSEENWLVVNNTWK